MKKIKSYISSLVGPVGIFIVWSLIVASTYEPGTILSGWDNLHPEFNFTANISRSLSAVWQEYQGVGLLGGMGHAADLPRQIILALLSVAINTNLLRYLWTFAMLLTGPIGAYYLAKQITKNSFAAFVSGLAYLLNFATVQTFFVPFEAFISFYGVLPALLLSATSYLKTGKKHSLLLYGLVLLLGSTAFYIQTHFVVYAMVLSVFAIEYLTRFKRKALGKLFKLAFVTLIVSAFWLLPVVYFGINGSDTLLLAKTSVMPTEETRLMNRAFGDLENIALMRGFWLEYSDLNSDKFGYLMPFWKEYTSTMLFESIGYLLFAIALIGTGIGALFRKNRWEVSVFAFFVFSFLMLTTGRGDLGFIYDLLTETIPLFGQMFRSSFTKWSSAYALSWSLGLGLLVAYMAKLSHKYKMIIGGICALVISSILLVHMRPVFKGNLISNNMQVEYPNEYFELFDYFRDQPKQARIARFPVHSMWGWDFFSWGYRGSGFLWYGIEQPILDRAFDQWSSKNEEYYQEMRMAVYTQNLEMLKNVLEKYDISYMILDKSVVVPEQTDEILRYDEIHTMLTAIGSEISWQKGDLTVYKLSAHSDFLYEITEYSKVENKADYSRIDRHYKNYGNYINGGSIFPFSDLDSERNDVNYESDLSGLYAVFERPINIENESKIVLPAFDSKKKYTLKAQASYSDNMLTLNLYNPYEVYLNEKKIDVDLFENEAYVSFDQNYANIAVSVNGDVFEIKQGEEKTIVFSAYTGEPLNVEVYDASEREDRLSASEFSQSQINKCWEREGAMGTINSNLVDGVLNIETSDAVGCTAHKLGDFSEGNYLLNFVVPYKSANGARPYYCIQAEGDAECKNQDIFYTTPTSPDWTEFSNYYVLPGNNSYWSVIGGRPPEEIGKSWSIDYRKPKAYFYPRITSVQFDQSIWEGVSQNREISVPQGETEIKVRVPIEKNIIDFGKGGRAESFNCDVFKRGITGKKLLKNGVEYTADNYGGNCDFVSLKADMADQGYLLRFIGENKTGRGFRFYLYNNTKRYAEIEGLLAGEQFDETYSLLPEYHDKASSDYILNVSIQSFRNPATSLLQEVHLYAVPLDFLANIKIMSSDEKIIGDVKINEHSKHGTAFYKANVSSKGGVVVLSQGYDSGWIALALPQELKINNLKFKILEHVEVNSWANGWEVPEGDHQIIIIYLPQILQWIGLLALPILFFVLLKAPRRRT